MHVRTIELRNFMSHDATTVDLPERGLVVVTGENGAGKSSLVEAVAVAFWGKTLRGPDPWRDGVTGCVSVRTDLGCATRSVSERGAKRLDWSSMGAPPVVWETTAKAQAGLESVVGSMDVWRRTHVFSSQDAAHFTLATDAERKRLLETILGLEVFDAAYDGVRSDLRSVENHEVFVTRDLALAKARVVAAERQVAQVDAVEDPEPIAPEVPESRSCLLDLLRQVTEARNQAIEGLEAEKADLSVALGEVERAEWRLEDLRRQEGLLAAGACPMCGGSVSADTPCLVGLGGRLEAAVRSCVVADVVEAAVRSRVQKSTERLVGLNAELQDAEARFRRAELASQAYASWQGQHASWRLRQESRGAQRRAAEAELLEATRGLQAFVQAHAAVACEAATLKVVSNVLGLRGVRAHVLGRALVGVEAVANSWLARIAQCPMEVSLRPYTQGKAGSVTDAISLEVRGAGGGRGYKAASGGERRRIDAALLLALAEVSAAAYGRASGTVFLDEVFDALDAAGAEAVAGALVGLAQERAVVLVTHAEALAERIPAVLRLHVVGGVVQRR